MHIKRSIFTAILFLTLAFTSVQAQTSSPDELLSQFEQIITEEMDFYDVPGAAVAVISGDEVIYAQGFGLRDVESGDPFTTETRFRIGSTTKSMTSMLIAQLVDEGLLTWDTPVTDILPDFRTADPALTEQIAVRDLMGMATGLISQDMTLFNWQWWDIQDLYDSVATMPIDGEFRNTHFYNNEVYALAGYIATTVSGLEPTEANYAALLQSYLFEPIGMDSAISTDDLSQLGDNYAHSYEPDLLGETGDFRRMIDPPTALMAPAGAVWTNIEDMARYVITQMNGGVTQEGTRIVSEENLAETWQPGASVEFGTDDFENVAYAMGWITQTYRGVPMRWHNGGWVGYGTQMAIFPESDTALIVFSNSSLGGAFNDALVYTFAELWHGLDVQAVEASRGNFTDILSQLNRIRQYISSEPIDAIRVEPFIGTYEGDWVVDMRDDGSLWVTHGAWEFQMVYMAMLGQYFVINNGAMGTQINFESEGDTINMVIQLGENDFARFARVE